MRGRLSGKIVLLAALALSVGFAGLGGPHGLIAHAATGVRIRPRPQGPMPTGRALRSELPGQVETMAEDEYPNTYAGSDITTGRYIIYTTTPGDPKFRAAVANLNIGHLPVYYARAKFSYNQLQTASDALTNHLNQLDADGVTAVGWEADPPFDAVHVTLLRPTYDDILTLSTSGLVPAGLTPVTQSNYFAAANAAIESVVGPNYKVEPHFGGFLEPV